MRDPTRIRQSPSIKAKNLTLQYFEEQEEFFERFYNVKVPKLSFLIAKSETNAKRRIVIQMLFNFFNKREFDDDDIKNIIERANSIPDKEIKVKPEPAAAKYVMGAVNVI